MIELALPPSPTLPLNPSAPVTPPPPRTAPSSGSAAAGQAPLAARWNSFEDGSHVSAREFARALSRLLHEVVRWTGGTGTAALVEGLRRTLSTDDQLSALPLDAVSVSPSTRREMREQAHRISGELVTWATADIAAADSRPDDEPVFVRSHCDGHPWTPTVAGILMGPNGGPESMQGYNEWLHQMVLLRDAMLPFENWLDVPFPVRPDGLRRLDQARERFAAELLFRQMRHSTVVGYAREVLAGDAGPSGYGFAYPLGTVLPTVVGRSPSSSPRHLLSWRSAGATARGASLSYGYAAADYFAATRSAVPASGSGDRGAGDFRPAAARLVPNPLTDSATTTAETSALALEISDDQGLRFHVDLGQAVRGHRYAHRPQRHEVATGTTGIRLAAKDVLSAPGMVWATSGTYVVDALHDAHVALALLGKIFPENVVVCADTGWGDLEGVGKKGTATFVIENADPRDPTGR